MEMRKKAASILLSVCLALTLLPVSALAAGTYQISSGPLTINSSNQSSYQGAVISGSVKNSGKYLVIDGATVDLTIRDLSIVMTGDGEYSAMELKNGAKVNLTLEGANILTGAYGGAGIAVPKGCSLTITDKSTGSLTATGGDNYGGGAGIGMIGNHYTMQAAPHVAQTLGDITIAGGTVVAQGGRNTYYNTRGMGSAGIGSSYCDTTPTSENAGSITITGGIVTATGGENAAGIGGGCENYVGSITVTGGSVTAIGSAGGAGIGGGMNTATQMSDLTPSGKITLSGGGVRAVCSSGASAIGYGFYQLESNKSVTGSSVAISPETAVQAEGEISPAATVTGNALPLSFTLEDGRVQSFAEKAYTLTVTDSTGKSVDFRGVRPVQESPAKALFSATLYTTLKDIASVRLAAADGTAWTGTLNSGKTTAAFGAPLCKATLLFKDSAVTGDLAVSGISIRQGGTALKAAEGEFYAPSVITEKSAGYGLMEIYLPAGTANTDISVTAAGLNGGKAMTVTGQTVSDQGTSSILMLKNAASQAEPFLGTLDISKGDISFSDASGDLKIVYTDANGTQQTATTLYEDTYTIAGSSTGNDAHQITVGNTNGQQLKLRLDGVTINNNVQAKSPVELAAGAAVSLETAGANTISHGQQSGSWYGVDKFSDCPTIHVPSGATLTLGGTGSLNVQSFIFSYGASIGGSGNCITSAAAEDGGNVILNSGSVSIYNNSGMNTGIGGGKATKMNSIGGSCGNVTVNGGLLRISSNAVSIGGGNGGENNGTGGSGGSVVINGGTVLLSNKIGAGTNSSNNGTVTITGGSVSANMAAAPSNGGAKVYKTTVDLSAQYGKNAPVPASGLSGLTAYGTKDLWTDDSGKLYFYLPVGAVKVMLNGTAYAGTVAANNDNVLSASHTLTVAVETVTNSTAQLSLTGEAGSTVYCAMSAVPLTDGSAVAAASTKSAVLSGTEGSLTLASLKEGTAYTCYLTAASGGEYSPVVAVSFTTNFAGADAASYTAIDYAAETLKAASGLSYTVQTADRADSDSWTTLDSSGGKSLSGLLDNGGGTIYVRKSHAGANGPAAAVTIPARAEYSGKTAVIDYAKETVSIAAGAEYQINQDCKGTWMPAPSAAISLNGFISDSSGCKTIFYRTKATDSRFASKVASSEYLHRPTSPDAPRTVSVSDTTVSLNTVSGGEYSKDGSIWQDSPVFTGLTAATAYTFYARIKATDHSFASPESKGISVTTAKYNLASATVTLAGGDRLSYSGDAQRPAVTVTLNGKTLTEGTDYTVRYETSGGDAADSPTNAGGYAAVVTGAGSCGGSVKAPFTIAPKALTITAAPQTIAYGGSIDTSLAKVTADGLVKDDVLSGAALTAKGADAVGTGTVTPSAAVVKNGAADVTANYQTVYVPGKLTVTKAPVSLAFHGYDSSKTYDGAPLSNPTADQLTLTGARYQDVVFVWYRDSVSDSNRLSSAPRDAGTYVVTAAVPATATASGADPVASAAMTIRARTVTPVVKLADLTFTYDGKVKTPAVTVMDGDTVIPAGEYTVSYSDNRGAGKAAVTVTDRAGGNYALESAGADFSIAPATVSVRPQDAVLTAGDAAPRLALAYQGVLSGETIAPANAPAFKLRQKDGKEIALADAVKRPGTYTIVWANMSAADYSAASNYHVAATDTGTLTVKPSPVAPIPVPADGDKSKDTVPVSSGTESIQADVTVKDRVAAISVSEQQAKELASGNTGTVKIDVSGLKADAAALPAAVVAAAENRGLSVALSTGAVTLDKTALAAVGKADVTVSVDRVDSTQLTFLQRFFLGRQADTAVIVDVNVTANGAKVSSFDGGSVRVTVPYTPKANVNPSRLVVWYITDNGWIERKTGSYDAVSGTFTFTTKHLSQYVLVSFPFTDVPADSWYYGGAAYAYMNGLFAGTSGTAFSPASPMTRQQMWMVLARMAGAKPADMAEAQKWATEQNVSDGSHPAAAVTREQFVTLLWRAAGSPKATKDMSGYTDFADVGSYAKDAMTWAAANGVLSGTSATTLGASSGATRAQIAVILMRYAQNRAK